MTPEALSLRQKIGQMFMITVNETEINGDMINILKQFYVGGVYLTSNNLHHPKQIYKLTKDLQHYSNKNLQLFTAAEQETAVKGMSTVPTQQKLGSLKNRLYTKQAADIAGKEMKAAGININLGPNLQLSEKSADSFSNIIRHTSQHGRALVEGYHKHNIIAAAKGFLNDYSLIPTDIPLYKTGIQPYIYAIEHGLEAIVTEKVDLAVPFLRDQLDFDGLILYHVPIREDLTGEIIEAVKNGADIMMMDLEYKTQIKLMEEVYQAVKQDEAIQRSIDTAVARIISKKQRFSIDEPPVFDRGSFMDKHAVYFMNKIDSMDAQ